MAERKIRVSNLAEGHGIVRAVLLNDIERFYDKMSQRLHGEVVLEVRFKEFHKGGKRERVESLATIVSPGIRLHATAEEWDARKATKEAFNAIEKEFEHKMKKTSLK